MKKGLFQEINFTYPNTIAVILVQNNDKINLMPVVWQIPLSYNPAIMGVLLSPERYTYSLINKSKNFTINYLEFKYADLISKIGTISGKNFDKVKNYKLRLKSSKFIKSPILKDAYVSFECRLMNKKKYGDHVLLSSKIININYKKEYFTKKGTIEVKKLKPLLYIGKSNYTTLDEKSKKYIKK